MYHNIAVGDHLVLLQRSISLLSWEQYTTEKVFPNAVAHEKHGVESVQDLSIARVPRIGSKMEVTP